MSPNFSYKIFAFKKINRTSQCVNHIYTASEILSVIKTIGSGLCLFSSVESILLKDDETRKTAYKNDGLKVHGPLSSNSFVV